MTANIDPVFTKIPALGMAVISTANTYRDGTGTMSTLLTGAENGTRITRITIQAIQTTTAGVVRLFFGDNAQTPNIRLWKEIAVAAITGSGSGTVVLEFSYTINLTGEYAINLPYGYTLRASTNNAESFVVIAEGGDY